MSNEKKQVQVELKADGTGSVMLGDVDISEHITRLAIDANAGRGTVVRVSLSAIERASVTGTPQLDGIDAMVLTSMGWLPPERAGAQRVINAQLRQNARSEAHQLENEREALVATLGMDWDSAWSEIIAEVTKLKKRAGGLEK